MPPQSRRPTSAPNSQDKLCELCQTAVARKSDVGVPVSGPSEIDRPSIRNVHRHSASPALFTHSASLQTEVSSTVTDAALLGSDGGGAWKTPASRREHYVERKASKSAKGARLF